MLLSPFFWAWIVWVVLIVIAKAIHPRKKQKLHNAKKSPHLSLDYRQQLITAGILNPTGDDSSV